MKNKKIAWLLSATVVLSLINVNVMAEGLTTFYVSPDGDDSALGTIDAPFATIEAARDAIRTLKEETGEVPEGGVCVYFREGVYPIHNSVEFTQEDSGTEESPITYRAYKDEKVSFIGAEELKVSDFRRVADKAVLERIYDSSARKCIYQYDLSEIDDFQYGGMFGGDSTPNELVIDGKLMTIARYPNMTADGKDRFEKPTIVNPDVAGEKLAFTIGETGRANNWKTADEAVLVANWMLLWSTTYNHLEGVKNGVVTTDLIQTAKSTSGSARFYAINLLEELDQPGEFYVDKENQMLYLYPPVDSGADSSIYISTLSDTMFRLKDTSYITLRDFAIPCSRGSIFRIDGGEHNLIAYCDITNVSGRPITIFSGTYNGAVGNYMSDCNGGVDVYGGDRNTLTPGNNYAENNEAQRFSRITKNYLGGVMINGCGNRAAHNEVHDALHLGMQFSGNENIIEYNEFYDLLQSVDDSGGIYAGRTWAWRGNRIRNNYFHDFYGSSGGVGLGCIYFDDSLSGNSITDNLFYNVPGRGVWAEAGSDNTIENNIMVKVGTPIRFADRNNSTAKLSDLAENNKHVTSLKAVPYKSAIWLEKYPIMAQIDKLPITAPNRNSIKNNVAVDSGTYSIANGVLSTGEVTNNISMNNAGFVDMANGDFRLKENAEVYTELPGFRDIHFEKMGRYTDKLNERVKDFVVLGIKKAGAKKNGESVQIDESNDMVMPLIINDRTMVPVRFISESLNAEVSWNGDSKEIDVAYNGKNIKMTVGSSIMTVNGEEVSLDSPPAIIENRTLIPLRALVEALDKKVFWDDKGLIVIGNDAKIFDSTEDAYLIDDLLRQIDLR